MSDCIFCSIVDGRIPARIVASDEKAIAFLDMSPWQDGHTLVIPRRHVADVLVDAEVIAECATLITRVGEMLKAGLGATACNIVSNAGADAGQEIFHAHVHVVPRHADSSGFSNLRGEASRNLDEVHRDLVG